MDLMATVLFLILWFTVPAALHRWSSAPNARQAAWLFVYALGPLCLLLLLMPTPKYCCPCGGPMLVSEWDQRRLGPDVTNFEERHAIFKYRRVCVRCDREEIEEVRALY